MSIHDNSNVHRLSDISLLYKTLRDLHKDSRSLNIKFTGISYGIIKVTSAKSAITHNPSAHAWLLYSREKKQFTFSMF